MTLVRRAAFALTLPLILFIAWWVLSSSSSNFFLPPLSTILAAFPETWFGGRLVTDVLPSLGRFAAGYALALVVGVGLGVILGLSRIVRATCEPVLEFFRAIPPSVIIPIVILFAGIGSEMKVIVIAFGCVWPVLLNTIEGVRSIDDVLQDTAAAYRLSAGRRLLRLVLPGASPQIFTGARQALAIGLILTVISEMFAANNGLGFTIIQFQRHFAVPEMWTGVILLGVIGFVLTVVFRIVENRSLAWYHGYRAHQER